MHTWTKTAGLLFLAAASVYSNQSNSAGAGRSVTPLSVDKPGTTDVKLLDEGNDPFAGMPTPTVTPVSSTTAPATQSTEGTSVSSAQVNVSDAGTVEIHVNDANLVEVLRMLSLQSQKNIIASKDVHGTVTANLYDVTVREALDAILHANGFAYREQGNFVYVYTAKELADIEKSERKQTTELFHLYYTPAVNAVNMIKPVLSADAQVSVSTPATAGLASGTTDVGGNTHAVEDVIVVTDFADNIERARKIIKEIDRRPQQILIEATILRAALTEDNALGMDFTVLGGVDFATLAPAGGTTAALSGSIINTNTAASNSIVNNGYAAGGTSFTQGVPPGGMRIGIVQNNIAVFLSALESVTDTVVLANPKVLALNKQKGEVIVGRKDGYLTTTTTDTSTVQTVEFLDTGTRLIFRPFIGDDGYIRMEIHPEDSSGGLTSANLPFKITTEVTSNVMVKDGHTIVIGGLFRESSDTGRGQVPFLGNLPLAGPLFRNQRDRTTREEVIIMLTPHIVKDDTEYSKASEEAMKELEKLRVGVRQGMMPFGRERLAESAYENAVEEMHKPNPDRKKALWYLDCATNLNPKFLEAIDLKQQLTGKEITTVDNGVTRTFVRKLILEDRAITPTTSPVTELDFLAATTRPTAVAPATTRPVAMGPATRPSAMPLATAAATLPVAAHPATQPLVEMHLPSPQPVAATPATQPFVEIPELKDVFVEVPAEERKTIPTTKPAHGEENVQSTTVTELPMEEPQK